ncbi:hypothetical protein [Acidipila sp. EB88]|uniref:hypothetical protein n=1 Tax=Acidipila sp. EB88 TaxID=2305226 RepID=UPI000F5E3C8C|nr:hypothetical protein [Acidipila sp. EB88]RRA48417.1 hypothetical protein D1Y84_09080 [Acidipila sp. EB88]
MTFRNPFLRAATLAACAFFSATHCCSLLHAQVTATAPAVVGTTEDERFDILGGAAYSHFNPGYAHQVRAVNLLGWQGSATGWISKSIGIEATARGLYGTYEIPANSFNVPAVNSSMSEHLFLFGPSARLYESPKAAAGMHLLVGGAYGAFDQGFHGTGVQPFQVGVYNNQLAFAYAVGGWADYKVRPRFAVRFTADYQPTHYASLNQNEFFGAVGIVYKIGRRK